MIIIAIVLPRESNKSKRGKKGINKNAKSLLKKFFMNQI